MLDDLNLHPQFVLRFPHACHATQEQDTYAHTKETNMGFSKKNGEKILSRHMPEKGLETAIPKKHLWFDNEK